MINSWYVSRLIPLLFFVFMNGLAFWSLIRWVPRLDRRIFRIGYWAMALLSIIPMFLALTSGRISWGAGDWLTRSIYYLAIVWNVGQFFVVLLLPFIYGTHRHYNRLNNVSEKTVEDPGEDPILLNRREFIEKVLWGLPLLGVGAAFKGVVIGDWQIVLRSFPLSFPNLSPSLDGLKIAQISDLHMGIFFSLEKLDRALALIEKESPDLLVITGDLADDANLLKEALERLAALQPRIPLGIHCVMGNHDYYHGKKEVKTLFAESSITLLINENRKLMDGPQPLYLSGVDYPFYNDRFKKEKFRLNFVEKALANVPENAFNILLSHHSDFLQQGFQKEIPLTLSGHSHGGQIAFLGQPIFTFLFTYIYGLYRSNNSYGYVTGGLGHWMPLRFGLPQEIVMFTLKSA